MLQRLRALWNWKRQEAELDEELEFHLSEVAEERLAEGSPRATLEARRRKISAIAP